MKLLVPLFTVLWLAGVGLGGSAAGSDLVTVYLNNGQKLEAAVDVRSSEQTLWLRFDRPNAVLYRPVSWDRVLRANVEGRELAGDAFRKIAARYATSRQFKRDVTAGETRAIPGVAGGGGTTFTTLAKQALAEELRVAALSIDAGVGNWDADPEIDGVVLYVSALNQAGEAVPARGTLSIELVSNRRSHLRPLPVTRRERFGRFGQWTRNLLPAAGGEAIYLLPFQAVHPEFDKAIDSFGMLHARLAVPGDGVFAATVSDLRIRPLSHYRNQLEASKGTRFLDTERTGRGKQFGG